MRYMVFVPIALLLLILVSACLPETLVAGPSFSFPTPDAITVPGSEELPDRTIEFPNFLPPQWQATFYPTSLFEAGDMVEIDAGLLTDSEKDGWLRVNNQPADKKGEQVSASYIFLVEGLPEDTSGMVRVKIDRVESAIAYHQKSSDDDWFWLREIYSARYIN